MQNDQMLKNAEKTLAVADDLIKIGKELPKVKGHEPITIFEALFLIFNQIDEGKNTTNGDHPEFEELIADTSNNLNGLPAFYHIQILRQFVSRYYSEVLPDSYSQDSDIDAETAAVINSAIGSLINDSERIINQENIIFSPIEIVYLYIESFISDSSNVSEKEATSFEYVLKRISIQKNVLLSYLTRYEELYKDKLKKEAINEE